MSSCSDKRYEDMLHAFEMGMLDEQDYDEFRQHLFDCRHCFERARKLELVAEIMRIDEDVRQVPGRVIEEQSKTGEEVSGRKRRWFRERFKPALVPASLIAVVVIIILVLKPWHIEIRSDQEAIAAENRLAIMYFENLATPGDPDRLGEITTNLLITDLSESRYLRVISSQRLHDILRLLGEDKGRIADREIALQIAEKAGAKWMLTGSILRAEPQFMFTAQLVEVSSGNLIASQQVSGADNEDVFSVVDRLTVQVKNDLALPVAAKEELDRRVADVTTHSPLAYRYYLEGVINNNKYYNTEAAELFRKAIQIDPSFAMAYYYLSLIDNPKLISEAVRYIDRAGREDGYFIRSREAQLAGNIDQAIKELQEVLEINPDDKEACYRIGICYASKLDFEMSIHYYKKAVEIDPLYKVVYNQMAYTYDWMGDFENSIQSIDMYISLAPHEPNPYDSRGDIYTVNGRLEAAIESYARALEIKPDFRASLYKTGKNYLLLGKYVLADSCFRELVNSGDSVWRVSSLSAQAFVPMRQGKFDEAIKVLDADIAAMEKEARGDETWFFHQLKAIIYEEKNELNRALQEYEESIRVYGRKYPDSKLYNRHLLVQLLARTGNIERAEEEAENFRMNIESVRDTLRYRYAAAAIELSKGNLEKAITGFEKAAEDSVIPYTPANIMLAETYYEAERRADAIDELKKLERDFTDSKMYYGSWTIRAEYLMGLCYEELGQFDLAIEQYGIFLDLWKDADPGIAIIDDARERLARLNSR